jgi:hypothetical protein
VKAMNQQRWRHIITAFVIWFLHFMVSWVASEIWPQQWSANAVAWGATALALLAVGMYSVQLKGQHSVGKLSGWSYRFAWGAIAIATVAVVFGALPSFVFLPR